jgi:hypothetical protein
MRLWRSSSEKQAAVEAKAEFEGLIAKLEADPDQAASVSAALRERAVAVALCRWGAYPASRLTLSRAARRNRPQALLEVLDADRHRAPRRAAATP